MLVNLDVNVIERLVVDSCTRKRDPGGIFDGLLNRLHKQVDGLQVGLRRQEFVPAGRPDLVADNLTRRCDELADEFADAPVEALMRLSDGEGNTMLGDGSVPSLDSDLTIGDVVIGQSAIDRAKRENFLVD